MRVAFTVVGGADWTGGHNYLINLLHVLHSHEKGRLTPVLFVPGIFTADAIAPFAAIPGTEIVPTALLDPGRRSRALLQSLLLGRDRALARLFREQQIDVVFESAQFFGWALGIPAIAWIPDFQHKALPRLFSPGARWKREIGFRAQVMGERTIMLSSDDARHACELHYPSTRGRTRTVRFAVPPGPPMPYLQARAVADAYGLPEQYYFLPNQFWRHKNHALVLDALVILRDRGRNVVVVASGRQADPRDAAYFPAFKERLEQAGLSREFRLLGLIPYPHLAPLMRVSRALINPSLFEGWSTTVEEARAMGTPMVLSDLAVHREQMGDGAEYFDPHDARSLADALDAFVPVEASQREARVAAARASAFERTRAFAAGFVALALWCRDRVASS